MTQSQPQPKRHFDWADAAALAFAFFAFVMSAYYSGAIFERLPHLEDELAYNFQARTLARGDLVIESPELRRAFWQPFVLDRDGSRFGKYTPGWPMLLAVGEVMGQPWVINAFLSALTVALTYRLARAVFNRDTGVIAAGLVAFSPMALLLNGTLMGHTAALFWTVLFMYAYWRIERAFGRSVNRALMWGLVAGVALGMLTATRPLTGAAVAIPFVAWSGLRLLRVLVRQRRDFFRALRPLLALTFAAIIPAATIPAYSLAAVGDPTENLYTLVWPYDQIGFGECCGRSGHTLEKGIRHTRFDLSLYAADLFGLALRAPAPPPQWSDLIGRDPGAFVRGWSLGEVTPDVVQHLRVDASYFPLFGISWVLLPFAALVIFRWRAALIVAWVIALLVWAAFPLQYEGGALLRDIPFGWAWVAVVFAWLLLPLMFTRTPTRAWAWLLAAVALSVLAAQFTYWIGSQRYSTRYYFESLVSVAILSAVPLAALIRWSSRRVAIARPLIYAAVFGLLILFYGIYTYPRIAYLHGFNNVSRDHIAEVEQRATDDRPILVIVHGTDVRWRAYGALMAETSPYLDSPIIAAWAYPNSGDVRGQLIARYPDRQVIEMGANIEDYWFLEPGDTAASDNAG